MVVLRASPFFLFLQCFQWNFPLQIVDYFSSKPMGILSDYFVTYTLGRGLNESLIKKSNVTELLERTKVYNCLMQGEVILM